MKSIISSKFAKATAWVSLVCVQAFAATAINIRGTVFDANSNVALSGATAALKANGLSGTTDSKGSFSLVQLAGVLSNPARESELPMHLEGSLLTYSVEEGLQQPVSISISDLRGRGTSLFAGTMQGGTHTMDLSGKVKTPGVYLLRVVVGQNRSTHAVQVQRGGKMASSETYETATTARSAATVWDTLTISKSGYATQKIALSSATDSVAKVLLQSTGTIPFNASLNAPAEGFANEGGAVTGGGSATPVTVTSCADLLKYAADKNPQVIRIKGTIKTTDCNGGYGLPITSNKTIIGVDKNATIYGGIVATNQTNIILRNFNMNGIYPNSGPDDAIAFHGCTRFWADHLNVWNGGDGNLDITNASNYGTVSWCKFWYTDKNHPHRLNSLIGSGAGDHPEDWGKEKMTFHHNWFAGLVNERMPRLMYGQAHVYNDYYTSTGNLYCIGFGSYGSILIENNYFKGVNNPISYMYDVYAWIVQRGNTFDNTTGTGKDLNGKYGSRFIEVTTYGDQHFNVTAFDKAPYSYTLDKTADVPNLVGTYAGPQ